MPDYQDPGANNPYAIPFGWGTDQKRAALAKAIEPEDWGQFHYLNHGARLFLVRSRTTRAARLLESLYFSGYSHGWLSIKEAEQLIRPFYRNTPKRIAKQIRKSRETVAILLQQSIADLRIAKLGESFPISGSNIISGVFGKKIPPKSHKNGMGAGEKRGRLQKRYWIPPTAAPNEVFESSEGTPVAFARMLESDAVYNSFVWKVPILTAGGRISIQQTEMAEELNISRSTQRVYAAMAGTRAHAYHSQCQLTIRQIAAMPEDRYGQRYKRNALTGSLFCYSHEKQEEQLGEECLRFFWNHKRGGQI